MSADIPMTAGSVVRPDATVGSRKPTQRKALVKQKASAPLSGKWLYAFVLSQIGCQLLLLTEIFGAVRLFVRIAAFAASLALLLFLRAKAQPHPSARAATLMLAVVGMGFFHPERNTILAGLAQIAMYTAIIGPVFWVSRLKVDLSILRRLLLILWCFHLVSSFFGLLQVYFPGQYQPQISTALGKDYLQGLYLVLPDGERVLRPMGLSDIPGGASTAGFYAMLLGSGFLLTVRKALLRVLILGGMTLGMFCLYMSQIRAVMVTAAVCLLTAAFILLLRGWLKQMAAFALVVVVIAVVGFSWAVSLAGGAVSDRIEELGQGSPGEVYYSNRGLFLEHTIEELLPMYPLGAGLGRWGMMNTYFGDDLTSAPIYVEIQWTGWLLDGGVPLILAYLVAIFISLRAAWRVSRRTGDPARRELELWGVILVAYHVGAFALSFSYPVFMSQTGLEFWLLTGAYFCTVRASQASSSRSGAT